MEFISYESPAEFQSRKKNKAIRSYVTKRQHRLRRAAEQEAVESANSAAPSPSNTQSPAAQPSSSSANGSSSTNAKPSAAGPSASKRNKKPRLQDQTRTKTPPQYGTLIENLTPRIPKQVPQHSMLPCDSALRHVESYIHLTMIPEHVAALGLDPREECQASSQWFSSSSITEPALYTSALLTAVPNVKKVSPELLFYLQSATVSYLVDALKNEQRRQDPALILAVECLTFYECLFGDKFLAQRVHRPAMRRLIQAQGGRDNLNIPRSWRKVSLMADIVMEIQMGSEGDTSFLEEEQHENGNVMDSEWIGALKMYLPDAEEKVSSVAGRTSG